MDVSPQPMIVDVVWLADSATEVHPVAEEVFRQLSGDPDGSTATRMGMPVYFRRMLAGGAALIDPATWRSAERRAVVLLVDEALLSSFSIRNSGTRAAIEQLERHAEANGWLLLPVALAAQAVSNPAINARVNMIRLPPDAEADPERSRFVASTVALELHRLLAPDRTVRAFISYATHDGGHIADGLKNHLDNDTHLQAFLDRTAIHAGESFSQVLDTSVIAGPVVAIVTDAYAASVWCGREIVLAKQAGQPVVVIDAIDDGHDRSFPYLGNGPVARWQATDPVSTYRRVVRLAVDESLRRSYLPLRIAHLCRLAGVERPSVVLTRAPELMTLVGTADGAATVVYPDPPIPSTELSLLRAAFPAIDLRTTTEVWR